MYQDRQSVNQFERMHARDRLTEAARHIGDDDDARLLGGHLSGERESQWVMIVWAIAIVAALAGFVFLNL